MIDIPRQSDEENHHAQLDVDRAPSPVGCGEGTIGGKVAADAGGVYKLEGESGQPDGDVDGGHGGVEVEGCE